MKFHLIFHWPNIYLRILKLLNYNVSMHISETDIIHKTILYEQYVGKQRPDSVSCHSNLDS